LSRYLTSDVSFKQVVYQRHPNDMGLNHTVLDHYFYQKSITKGHQQNVKNIDCSWFGLVWFGLVWFGLV